jgi:hypothetical protein
MLGDSCRACNSIDDTPKLGRPNKLLCNSKGDVITWKFHKIHPCYMIEASDVALQLPYFVPYDWSAYVRGIFS